MSHSTRAWRERLVSRDVPAFTSQRRTEKASHQTQDSLQPLTHYLCRRPAVLPEKSVLTCSRRPRRLTARSSRHVHLNAASWALTLPPSRKPFTKYFLTGKPAIHAQAPMFVILLQPQNLLMIHHTVPMPERTRDSQSACPTTHAMSSTLMISPHQSKLYPA